MKKFKNIIIFTHEKYLKNKDVKTLVSFLKKKKISCEFLIQSSNEVKILSNNKIVKPHTSLKKTTLGNQGLVIVFGGDGLFLSASKFAFILDIPILGINFGKIGFLVDVDKKNALKEIAQIILGKYILDNRILIDAKVTNIQNNQITSTSLNDIVIHNYGLLRMIQVKIHVNNYLINVQRSDGIIIATPTGSTAYSMSNGCPIVSPDANVISITPISPHTYSHRPLIINAKDKITVEVERDSIKHSLVTFDGGNNLNVNHPKTIEIKKSKKILKIIHPNNYNYFQILNKKLKWGGRS